MQSGIIHTVARYKVIPNYAQDLSNYPPDENVMKTIPYSYSVSVPITITSLSSTTPTEFTFDFTGNPIPAGITDLYLHAVFKGTLGSEADIAIAAGMKDLMEPTHHVFWNLTDMFSLYGHLYTAQQIRADPNLLSLADGAYIDPHDMTFEISYMGESPPVNPLNPLATVLLPAGRFIRLIVLVDRQANNYVRMAWSDNIDTNEAHYDTTFQGVMNEELEGVWQTPTPLITFRTVRQHLYSGILRCEPQGVDPVTGRPVCPYPEQEAIPADITPRPAVISFP
jgi:hypothetical protein